MSRLIKWKTTCKYYRQREIHVQSLDRKIMHVYQIVSAYIFHESTPKHKRHNGGLSLLLFVDLLSTVICHPSSPSNDKMEYFLLCYFETSYIFLLIFLSVQQCDDYLTCLLLESRCVSFSFISENKQCAQHCLLLTNNF